MKGDKIPEVHGQPALPIPPKVDLTVAFEAAMDLRAIVGELHLDQFRDPLQHDRKGLRRLSQALFAAAISIDTLSRYVRHEEDKLLARDVAKAPVVRVKTPYSKPQWMERVEALPADEYARLMEQLGLEGME